MVAFGGGATAYDELRQQVAYEGLGRDAIRQRLDDSADVVGQVLEPPLAVRTQERLTSQPVVDALSQAYGCVRVLVGTELDTRTPGERGLGRMSTATPRFGGHFREQMTQHWQAQVGPLMEYLVIEGFAAAVVYDFLGSESPAEVRQRPVEEIFDRWVMHIGLALDRASDSFLSVANTLAEGTSMAFRLACSAMLNEARRKPKAMKKREEAVVSSTAAFLVGSGADLFWFVSSRTDDRFGR